MLRHWEIVTARIACFAIVALASFAQTRPDEPANSVHLSGRLVFPDGSPASYSVRISRIEPDGPIDETPVTSNGLGIFTFLGAPHKKYRLSLGYEFKTPPRTVDTESGKDIDVGDILFERCPPMNYAIPKAPTSPPELIGDLKLEQIVIEPQQLRGQFRGIATHETTAAQNTRAPEVPQCWSGPSLDRRAEWEPLCMISFDHYLTVEAFVGGKVKSIRVIHYDQKLSPLQIREEVRRVWLGVFWYTTCGIVWSEGNRWNVEAVVEYEGGERGSILMDGGTHVEVQDRQGKYWYMREWPAVQ